MSVDELISSYLANGLGGRHAAQPMEPGGHGNVGNVLAPRHRADVPVVEIGIAVEGGLAPRHRAELTG